MAEYPLNLEVEGRLCVVVGGGAVGMRKARTLLACGARLVLVEPHPVPEAESLNGLVLVRRPYCRQDLEGATLVFAATGDRRLNADIARDAREAGAMVNVADAPLEGDFTLPALARRGDLLLAVSSGGKSPALAALLRDLLAESVGPEWAVLTEIAAALRQKRLTLPEAGEYNQAALRRLLEQDICALIAARDRDGINRLLKSQFGEEVSLSTLGVQLPTGTP